MARKPIKQEPPTAALIPLFPKFREYDKEFDNSQVFYRSMSEIIKDAEANKTEIMASLIEVNRNTYKYRSSNYGQTKFIEAYKKYESQVSEQLSQLREGCGSFDSFGVAGGSGGLGLVGNDFVPLLAGPINKQQYLQDYLQGQAECFFAYHHDPFCRGAVNVLKHFTIGKGYRADCEDKKALALWKAFEQVNKIPDLLNYMAIELPVQGEIMVYWLPQGKTFLSIDNPAALEAPKGVIPRVRLLDTSAIWEVITLPEDINEVFAYQQVYISQWQTYTTQVKGTSVPTSKTIIRQIPASEVDHYKLNCLSGEKRGRSDMYPVLGFAKRLRDTIQYSVVQTQKQAAFSFDTMVDGAPSDVQAYSQAVKNLGQMPEAGTEFIHSKKVTRTPVSFSGSSTQQTSFEWCLSAFCAGVGIPMNFLGTHLSGGQTRASALTATEPSYKRFEERQLLYKKILTDMSQRLFKQNGINATMEFTFHDLLNQDRTAKLNQLLLTQEAGWFNRERCANMAASEMAVGDFKFDQEHADKPVEEEPRPISEPSTVAPSGGVSGRQRSEVRGQA